MGCLNEYARHGQRSFKDGFLCGCGTFFVFPVKFGVEQSVFICLLMILRNRIFDNDASERWWVCDCRLSPFGEQTCESVAYNLVCSALIRAGLVSGGSPGRDSTDPGGVTPGPTNVCVGAWNFQKSGVDFLLGYMGPSGIFRGSTVGLMNLGDILSEVRGTVSAELTEVVDICTCACAYTRRFGAVSWI
jgi:hypothetical protein